MQKKKNTSKKFFRSVRIHKICKDKVMTRMQSDGHNNKHAWVHQLKIRECNLFDCFVVFLECRLSLIPCTLHWSSSEVQDSSLSFIPSHGHRQVSYARWVTLFSTFPSSSFSDFSSSLISNTSFCSLSSLKKSGQQSSVLQLRNLISWITSSSPQVIKLTTLPHRDVCRVQSGICNWARFSEDLDYDDRFRSDALQRVPKTSRSLLKKKGQSSCLSSSSMSHGGTKEIVVDRDASHTSGQEIRR